MSHIELYLWKEWRDHRVGVLCLIVVLPLLFVLAVFAWDARILGMALSPGIAAAVGAKIAALHVGADLIPGELRRSRVQFLERLPSGLERAFSAKLIFFAGLTLFAALYSVAIAIALHMLVTGQAPEQFLDASSEQYVLPAIACALWVFAVSAWVPHGALALPAALIVIAILCSPALFFFGPESALEPTIVELRAFCALSAIGAGVTAWFSFVRGYRFGANPARAARIGAVTAVLCLAPAWAWCGLRWNAARTLDPHSMHFHISAACLAEDGTTLYVDATDAHGKGIRNGHRKTAIRLDLRTGEWKAIGSAMWPGEYVPHERDASPAPRVRSMIVPAEDASGILEIDAAGRAIPTTKLPASSPALLTIGQIGLDERAEILGWAGLGLRVFGVRGVGWGSFYDPFRKRLFDPAVLFPEMRERDRVRVAIRPGRWIIERHPGSGYELFDPETLESSPPPGFSAEDRIGPVLADGRFLVARGDVIGIYSPETGAREPLSVRGVLPGRVQSMRVVSPLHAPMETFHPHLVLLCGSNWNALARIDLDRRELVPALCTQAWPHLVACVDPETVLAIEDHRKIVKLRFGTNEREVVFPRED
jgi:hypothetical protein